MALQGIFERILRTKSFNVKDLLINYRRHDFIMNPTFLQWEDPGSIEFLTTALRQNCVVLGSSDTVLGLLAPITESGFLALNNIKGRQEKPYLLLIGSKDKIVDFAEHLSPQAEELMHHCWPGPVTLIVKAKKNLPAFITSSSGTIALRYPNHEGLQTLLKRFDALFSTSANLAGQPTPIRLQDVDDKLINHVTAVVTDKDPVAQSALPSTIVDCTGDTIHVIREGIYPVSLIYDFIRTKE